MDCNSTVEAYAQEDPGEDDEEMEDWGPPGEAEIRHGGQLQEEELNSKEERKVHLKCTI